MGVAFSGLQTTDFCVLILPVAKDNTKCSRIRLLSSLIFM